MSSSDPSVSQQQRGGVRATSSRRGPCPVCGVYFPISVLNSHAEMCWAPGEKEDRAAGLLQMSKRSKSEKPIAAAAAARAAAPAENKTMQFGNGVFLEAYELPERLVEIVHRADSNATKTVLANKFSEKSGSSLPDDSISYSEQVDRLIKCAANNVHAIQHILWEPSGTLQRGPLSVETASSYWSALVATCKDDPSKPVETIGDALHQFREGRLNHAELMHVVAGALAGHDRLIMAFDMFLPPDLSMTNLVMLQKTAMATACAVDRTLQNDQRRLHYIARSVTEESALALRERRGADMPLRPRSGTLSGGGGKPEQPNINFELVNDWVDQVGQKMGAESKDFHKLLKYLIALGSARPDQRQELIRAVRSLISEDERLLMVFDCIVSVVAS